jgi:hypothetical protein
MRVGISVCMRTESNVLPCTLDVCPIRRGILGKGRHQGCRATWPAYTNAGSTASALRKNATDRVTSSIRRSAQKASTARDGLEGIAAIVADSLVVGDRAGGDGTDSAKGGLLLVPAPFRLLLLFLE